MRYCTVKGCKNKHLAQGLCSSHYHIKYRENDNLSSERATYLAIIQRCCNKNNKQYNNYGGRGIKVCDEWLGENGFINFYTCMGERPLGKTLDRIDNNKGYSPKNCRWTSTNMQMINQRLNKRNTSGYRGVSVGRNSKWVATIGYKGNICLGIFDNIENAAIAYDCMAIQIYGDDANLNIL